MNLRFIILTTMLFLSHFRSASQPVRIEAAEINRYKIITPATWYFAADTLVPLDSVIKPEMQNQFQKLPDKGVVFLGYDPHFYWYRLILQNTDTVARDYVLILGGLGIRKADLWEKQQGTWRFNSTTGYELPMEVRPYRYAHPAFRLQVTRAAVDTFLIKVDESHSYKSVSFVLVDGAAMRMYAHRFYFIIGGMIGLLFLFVVFNVYLFIAVKEKIHIWYALYIFMMMIFIIKEEGIDPEFLHLDSSNGFRMTSMLAFACFAVTFLLQVVQQFLVNLSKTDFWFRALQFLKWFVFVMGTIQLIVFYIQPANIIESVVFHICTKAGLLSFLLVICSCLYSFRKGFRPAIFLLAGELVFITGAITRTLFVGMSSHIFPPSLFEIGIVVEVIIISYGLMYRYNQYKKEKDNLAVQLQFQKAKAAEEILMTQEQEQKRIAADLHDEMGGNLAAIKMTLQSFDLPEEQTNQVTVLIDKVSDNARHIAHNLMPPDFENTPLPVLLDGYYRQLNTRSQTRFNFYWSDDINHFEKSEELIIYRIFMEITNNILKHSHATEVTIQMLYGENELTLMAEDNGRGIADAGVQGIGMKSIHSRVDFLNGTMNIDSASTGTTIIISIPFNDIK